MKEITATSLLSLALNELAATSLDPCNCWLKRGAEFHREIWELTKRHRKILTPLKKFHFMESGAFPYSLELETALSILYQSGLIKRGELLQLLLKFAPTYVAGTKEFHEKEKQEIFAGDPEALKAFQEFAEGLKVLIIKEE